MSDLGWGGLGDCILQIIIAIVIITEDFCNKSLLFLRSSVITCSLLINDEELKNCAETSIKLTADFCH